MNPPVNIQWDRQHGLVEDHDDLSEIRILTPVEQQQARRDSMTRHPSHQQSEAPKDDGARLTGADAHRRKAVDEMTTRIVQAGLELIAARGWAAAIGYHNDVRDALTEAISTVTHIQDLLSIHEDLK
jgi:hypothetical protein